VLGQEIAPGLHEVSDQYELLIGVRVEIGESLLCTGTIDL
jgi:hypothetical protein